MTNPSEANLARALELAPDTDRDALHAVARALDAAESRGADMLRQHLARAALRKDPYYAAENDESVLGRNDGASLDCPY